MKRLENWRASTYPSAPDHRLLPHAYYLADTGYEEEIPGPIIFLEEPNFDDDGNCTVERMLLPARIKAIAPEVVPAVITNAAAPAVVPKANKSNNRGFAPRKKKKR